MKTIILALASVVLISACDIVEPPFRKNFTPRDTTDNSDTLSNKRIVLLEKFTGAACGPCPPANDEAQRLVSVYRDVSVISYHAGQFAKPEPSGGYVYDFRTPIAEEIGTAFLVNIQTPLGCIDRVGFGNLTQIRIPFSRWDGNVENRDSLPSPIAIRLYPWYDPNTKTITVSGSIHYLQDGFKDYHLTLALTEDSIIKPQKLVSTKIDNYNHKFVFRANIPNITWGLPVSTTDQPKGSKVEFTRTLQFPNNADWNPKHLKVVGYVFRNLDAPIVSREVLQSTTKKVSIVQ